LEIALKSLLSVAPGGPDTLVLREIPDPVAKKGELLVAVRACAINFPDALVIEDKYQFRPERPFAPGGEISGIVEAVGPDVEGWTVGDRVIAVTRHGGLSEKIAVSAIDACRLPENRNFEDGAALLFTYGTAIHALLDRGHLKPGETLLVLGAAGGVGLAAIELGKAVGARVIAAVSSEEKAAAARAAGADAVMVYGVAPLDKAQSRALAEQFKLMAGPAGADIIFDPVGGPYAEPALRSIGWQGRYLVVGFAAGIPALPLNLTLLKGCDVCGIFWGEFTRKDPAANRAHYGHLFRLWDEGKIAPRVTETFPLKRGGEAIQKMAERRSIGKLVVTTG
jgi:NADPH:quinone reductase-like Zn-dependent oxidoreductase